MKCVLSKSKRLPKDLKGQDRLLFLILIDLAMDKGFCFPGPGTLAIALGLADSEDIEENNATYKLAKKSLSGSVSRLESLQLIKVFHTQSKRKRDLCKVFGPAFLTVNIYPRDYICPQEYFSNNNVDRQFDENDLADYHQWIAEYQTHQKKFFENQEEGPKQKGPLPPEKPHAVTKIDKGELSTANAMNNSFIETDIEILAQACLDHIDRYGNNEAWYIANPHNRRSIHAAFRKRFIAILKAGAEPEELRQTVLFTLRDYELFQYMKTAKKFYDNFEKLNSWRDTGESLVLSNDLANGYKLQNEALRPAFARWIEFLLQKGEGVDSRCCADVELKLSKSADPARIVNDAIAAGYRDIYPLASNW